jgi:hypothetical protein
MPHPCRSGLVVVRALKEIDLKLHAKLCAAGTLTLAALTVAACQSQTRRAQVSEERGLCRRDAAEALAGKNRVTDAEALQITGATLVRQIRPGQGVTMDFRQERVTIETDPKSGSIVRAYCG